MLRLTQSGVVDIGYIGPSYVSDKMPLSEVAQLPGAFETACQGTMAYWKAAREGILAKQEYAPNKIKLLLAVVLPPYQVWTVKSKVETTKDMQGLKLRTTGGAQDLTLRALNAVPVRMAAPDAYESLSRGTMDGLLFPLDSVASYGLDKLVKHATEGVSFGSFIVAYSINQSVWDKLPDDVKKAMNEASEAITPQACAGVEKEGEVTKKQMQDEGISFDPLPEATRTEIKDKLKGVGKEWASGLDSRGKQASAALKEFDDLLTAGGAK
jgi:TRAP-type C4-dicarboxylate transport system substrate-binding protein